MANPTFDAVTSDDCVCFGKCIVFESHLEFTMPSNGNRRQLFPKVNGIAGDELRYSSRKCALCTLLRPVFAWSLVRTLAISSKLSRPLRKLIQVSSSSSDSFFVASCSKMSLIAGPINVMARRLFGPKAIPTPISAYSRAALYTRKVCRGAINQWQEQCLQYRHQ